MELFCVVIDTKLSSEIRSRNFNSKFGLGIKKKIQKYYLSARLLFANEKNIGIKAFTDFVNDFDIRSGPDGFLYADFHMG